MSKILDSRAFALSTLALGLLGVLTMVGIAIAGGPQAGQLCDTEAKAKLPPNVVYGNHEPWDWRPFDPNDFFDSIECTTLDCLDDCGPEYWKQPHPQFPDLYWRIVTCGCPDPPGGVGPGDDPPSGEPVTDFCTIYSLSEGQLAFPWIPPKWNGYTCWGSCPDEGQECGLEEGTQMWDQGQLVWCYLSCYCN